MGNELQVLKGKIRKVLWSFGCELPLVTNLILLVNKEINNEEKVWRRGKK